MRRAWPAAAAVLALAAARAQDATPAAAAWQVLAHGHRLRVVAVPGIAAQAIAIVWPHGGADADAAEVAGAIAAAAFRRRAADALFGAGQAAPTSVELCRDAAVFTVVLQRATANGAADWFRALCQPAAPAADADGIARLVARAALEADDAAWLYPGSVLRQRAMAAFALGPADPARPLQALLPATVAARVAAAPAPLYAVVVGDPTGGGEFAAALAALATAAPAPANAASAATVRSSPGAPAAEYRPHARVDAAYVAAAVRAPAAGPEQVGFAVGVAVLRTRAVERFRGYRGGEPLARAPFVAFDFLAGDPLVLLCRRGGDGDPAAPRRELEALLADLVAAPPTAREVAAAARLLAAEWAVPPWPREQVAAHAAAPGSLCARARTLALLCRRGIDDAAVRALPSIDPAEVGARLAAALPAAATWWGGLVPTAGDPFGR